MKTTRAVAITIVAVSLSLGATFEARQSVAAKRPTAADYISPGYPSAMVSAARTDRIAWIAYEEGRRNVYTAVAPSFSPVRLTNFMKDDGVDLTDIRISADGTTVAFVRGHAANRDGWVANPSSQPEGGSRTIWAARVATPGTAWQLAEGASPELAPDGSFVVFARDGQIRRATVGPRAAAPVDRGEVPFIRAWGTNSNPRFSPDGRFISFQSNRVDHSFVGIYDVAAHAVKYMSPSVDFDTSATWSHDGKRIAFIRRPGLPFGQQAQQGGGGVGLPNGPAFQGTTGNTGRGGGGAPPAAAQGRQGGAPPAAQGRQGGAAQGGAAGQGAQGGRGGGNPNIPPAAQQIPGLTRATFRGGYTTSIWIGDPATGEAKEVWHTEPQETFLTRINNIQWAGDHVIFQLAQNNDEWERWHSLPLNGPVTAKSTLLTTTNGLIEDATSVALSKDGRTFFYTTNHGDIDRRDLWMVPTAGGEPKQVTKGAGIETYPVPLSSGTRMAALYADWKTPQSVAIVQVSTGESRTIYPTLPANFPQALHVEPTAVTLKAADGFEFYNQLFLPKDIKPGEKRPAMVFVHGGPVRQMLLGYHYRHFYHMAYGINQWLANQGYVVLSVNFRSGVGYGRSFRTAPRTGAGGNSEYGDVLAAGQYLQARPDVDPKRIAIWGLSYGGVLTAQALARNSDIFAAGIDIAGVHLWQSSLDPESTSFKSSAIGAIDTWKSPVLIVHGDDDRNVMFQQTTGLVQLLRARDVEFELIVFPDDVHDFLIHQRWVYTFDRMDQFLKKHLNGITP